MKRVTRGADCGRIRAMLVRKPRSFVRLGLAFAAIWTIPGLLAEPVSPDLAKEAVCTWLQSGRHPGLRAGRSVSSARAVSTGNGATFNVVRLHGGGFVVTSGDTEIDPIIAFSDSSEFVDGRQSPLWVMLDRDLSARASRRKSVAYANSSSAGEKLLSASEARWAELTQGALPEGALRKSVDYMVMGKGSISDVRCAPMIATKWGQDGPCYNYYTPNNYSCGCVATATAQIMRYFRYPTGYVTPQSNVCNVQIGIKYLPGGYYTVQYMPQRLSMQGGYYDWDNMPEVPDDSTPTVQCEAIGKLTSDLGIACFMDYSEYGSGAGGYMAAPTLTGVFGYANALPIISPERNSTFSGEVLRSVLIPNLDAKLPVLASLYCEDGGHAVVADGYGYSSGTFYVHFCMGWEGIDDAWYAPPLVAEFTAIDTFVYNIYTTGHAGDVICSGRVLSSSTGLPVSGAKVSVAKPGEHTRGECTTDNKGIYALILSPGKHQLTASNSRGSATGSVTLHACSGAKLQGTYYIVGKEGTVSNVYGFDLKLQADDPSSTPEPTPEPTPAQGVTYAGEFDVNFRTAQKVMSALYQNGAPVGTVQIKAGKQNAKTGMVKVSGSVSMMVNGKIKKFTAKAKQMEFVGGKTMSGTLEFKLPVGSMSLEMVAGGRFTLGNSKYEARDVAVGGALKDGTYVFGLKDFGLDVPGELQDDLLPDGDEFQSVGGRWTFGKNASVKLAKDQAGRYVRVGTDDLSKPNLSSLKLTYSASKGEFKGSFKAYAIEDSNGKEKLKKYTVKVAGFVIDGVGQGEASCTKSAGTWTVTVKRK